ncbi:MAG TPA: BamA/TamA family outer membrane protein [Burkholderiaceae bacterium]|nr:BamA/TamA family outer membrane protein [Burkholderiaceae bacterium]
MAMLVPMSAACAAQWLEDLKDPDDGHLDLSEWLLDSKGFLPVPIIITEPALGFGGGVVATFFRESIREASSRRQDQGRLAPPDIYFIGGGATENGTWFGAGGGMVSFDNDRFRWRGGVMRMSVNLDFYGFGGNLGPIGYNLDGWASVQHGMWRLGQSDWWAVARWNYLDLQSRFNFESQVAQLPDLVRTNKASGLGLSLEVDTRDNIFTPSRGYTGSIDATFYDPDWGSDTSFQSYRAHAFGYWPIGKEWVIGGRIDGRTVDGRVPFFMLPYVDLRGVPAARLQDRHTAVLETELRWNMTPRWALIGFVGGGKAWGTTTSYSDGADTVARGVGFRYLIARRLGLYLGVDVAKSTQDHAVYLQVGSAWR